MEKHGESPQMAFPDEGKIFLPFNYYIRTKEIIGQMQYIDRKGADPVVFSRLKQYSSVKYGQINLI